MAIHTFELVSPTLTYKNFNQYHSQVFNLVNSGQCRIIKLKKDVLSFQINFIRGTLWTLIASNVPYLSIKVNPSILFGGGYTDLCNITLEAIEACAASINKALEMLGAAMTFSELILHRIDCTIDVQFSHDDAMEDFIACLQRTHHLRGYRLDSFDMSFGNFQEKNQHSFRMSCNDVTLTVYDKSYQLREEKLMNIEDIPPNRLRFEAAFQNSAFQRLFYQYHQCVEIDCLNQKIIWVSRMSVPILREYFERTIAPGRYLKLRPALDLINQSSYTPKTKDRMKDFLHEVKRCHQTGIAGAIEAFRVRGYSKKKIQNILKNSQNSI
ncbi:MAG: hypothetical protein K2O18_07550 [Oscillospiraceae bacterium]|nr:hypothetical protein [Oscillospiraceae bacterium]